MSMMDAERNRRIRVAILELLKTQYPGTMDVKQLRYVLSKIGYALLDNQIAAHLTYLEEKGFVRCEDRKQYGFDIQWCELTAKGWDFLDGHITEKGIDEEL
jgi:repressor of nif and glnA expression